MVVIGRLGRPRGVQGELYVTPLTDFPERFLGMNEIHVRNREGGWSLLRIAASAMVSGRPVVRFAGIDNPEQAQLLTNSDLAITPDQLVTLPDGSFFLFDLVGCQVIDVTTGTPVGSVVKVDQYPANDVYVVQTDGGQEK